MTHHIDDDDEDRHEHHHGHKHHKHSRDDDKDEKDDEEESEWDNQFKEHKHFQNVTFTWWPPADFSEENIFFVYVLFN